MKGLPYQVYFNGFTFATGKRGQTIFFLFGYIRQSVIYNNKKVF